ncbi:hypothetical protein K4F52_005406 [Lecanicillium sp. MT-2017a]|nr:hypothetical protein K4F52_005406 [Lecanicillium sp. MT-2017a]
MELQNPTIPQGKEVMDFMLYITGRASRRDAKGMLFAYVADIRERFHCKDLYEYSAQQVCQYHRQHYPDGNKDGIHASNFLLFDSDEPKTRGVLLVDLRKDTGYADAVRRLPSEAALGAAAVAVGSSDWQTTRQTAFTMPGENSLVLARFALYNLADGTPFAKRALSRIDCGIHDLDIYEYQDTGSMQSGEAEENEDHYNFRYEVIIPGTKDSTVEDIIGRHNGIASAKGLDDNRFVILDNEYEQEGVLIVQVDPKDQFLCKGAPAGELIWWIAIGFTT